MNKPSWSVFLFVVFVAWLVYFILPYLPDSTTSTHAPVISLGFSQQYSDQVEPPEASRRLTFYHEDESLLSFRNDGWVDEWTLAGNVSSHVVQTQDVFAFLQSGPSVIIREKSNRLLVMDLSSKTKHFITEGEYVYSAIDDRGKFIVLAKGDRTLEVWNLQKKERVAVWETTQPIRNGLALSSNGHLVAVAEGTYDGTVNGHQTIIEVWGLHGSEPTLLWHKKESGIAYGVWNLIFSPDGSRLAFDTQKDGKSGFLLVEAETGAVMFDQHGSESYWIRALAFSPKGKFLASGDELGNVRVWDISNGKRIWNTQVGQVVESLSFSSETHRLAAGLRDSTIPIWDISSVYSPKQ